MRVWDAKGEAVQVRREDVDFVFDGLVRVFVLEDLPVGDVEPLSRSGV